MSQKNPIQIEVCANSVESALAAQEGGADRVELCDNLFEGGTTPSWGCLEIARERLQIGLFVMIRPRGGDFCYSPLEYEIMKRDIMAAKRLRADGVVLGLLNPSGEIDVEYTRELVELARPMKVTFHRAFDMSRDPLRTLDDLMDIGVDRVLTSGMENKAIDGAALIARLVQRAAGRIHILVGSGVNENNLEELHTKTQAREFHVTGRKNVASPMIYRNERIHMGGVEGIPEYEKSVTDPDRIRKIVETARTIWKVGAPPTSISDGQC